MRQFIALMLVALLIVAIGVYAGYEQQPDSDGTFKRLLLRQNRFLDSLSQYTQKDVELIASYRRFPSMDSTGLNFEPGPQVRLAEDWSKAAIFWFSTAELAENITAGEWSCYQVEPLWNHNKEEKQ